MAPRNRAPVGRPRDIGFLTLNSGPAGREDPSIVLVVEIEDVAQDRIGKFRAENQVLQCRFKPAQIAVQQERLVAEQKEKQA